MKEVSKMDMKKIKFKYGFILLLLPLESVSTLTQKMINPVFHWE